jgi:glycosyltransferase involved in cell wall biosynthesis
MTTRTTTPLISVVIPTYNNRDFIVDAVESVLAQTYPAVEVIVVDDGSTDDTALLLEKYQGRIRYIWQANQERSQARNRGIREGNGEWIAFIDADDIWLPQKLEKQVLLLNTDPRIGLVYSLLTFINPQRHILRSLEAAPCTQDYQGCDLFADLVLANVVGTPSTVLVRRDCLPEPAFAPELRQGEDWHLWLHVAAHHLIARLPEPLCLFRIYPGSYPARMAARGGQEAHLWIMNDLREKLDTSRFSKRLYEQGCTRALFDGALIDIAIGQKEAACERLQRASRQDLEFFQHAHLWESRLLDFAESLDYMQTTPTQSKRFINTFFAALPPALEYLKVERRAMLSKIYASRLFKGQARSTTGSLLAAICQAVWYDPSWLNNRGFLAIGLRSFLEQFSNHIC